MQSLKIVLAAGLCLALAACAYPPGQPQQPGFVKGKIETPEIRLQVKNGQLEVTNSDTPKCPGPGSSAKGCIVTGVEDIAFARFVLKGSGQYSLTTLWVCDSADKPALKDQNDPESFECELLGDRANEFLVIVGGSVLKPDSAGSVALGGVREFSLLNQNSFAADYFYLIKACQNNGTCSILDPRIRNGGRYVIR